jgi:hypothetical protein
MINFLISDNLKMMKEEANTCYLFNEFDILRTLEHISFQVLELYPQKH